MTAAYHRYFSHRASRPRAGSSSCSRSARRARAEGRALVGRPPPLSPQAFRHAARPPLRQAARLLVVAHGLDPGSHWTRRHEPRRVGDSRGTPSCASSTAGASSCYPRSPLARSCYLASAAAGVRLGLPRLDGAALARHVHDQLAVAPVRLAPLRDRRRLAQQPVLALLTMGEGWHNNHHHYQSSANQGFRWWEIDVTYYVLRRSSASAWSGTCAARRPRCCARQETRPPTPRLSEGRLSCPLAIRAPVHCSPAPAGVTGSCAQTPAPGW